MKNAIKETT